MEAIISLEVVWNRQIVMILIRSGDSNVDLLKKFLEKNISEKLCVKSDGGDELFLAINSRKSIWLYLTDLNLNGMDDEVGKPVPFLIIEPTRFDCWVKMYWTKACTNSSMATECGLSVQIYQSTPIDPNAAIVTNWNSQVATTMVSIASTVFVRFATNGE